MKRTFLLVFAFLAACTGATVEDPITTPMQALQEIRGLDTKYNTSFQEETLHTLDLRRPAISDYLKDLRGLQGRVTDDDGKYNNTYYMIEFRKQSLQAQYKFQTAWVGIGEAGRVKDGFTCNDGRAIKRANRLLEESIRLMANATSILDTLLTENKDVRKAIGIDEDKPALYSSNIEEIRGVINQNKAGYKSQCTGGIRDG